MILRQFAHAHNVFFFNFLPVLNIDCLPKRSKGVSYVVPTGSNSVVFCTTPKLLSFSSNSSCCRHILMVYSRTLKITPTQSGFYHRKFADTFWRPLPTDRKKHVSKVLNPFNVHILSSDIRSLQTVNQDNWTNILVILSLSCTLSSYLQGTHDDFAKHHIKLTTTYLIHSQ